ncbi:inner nuclear membrane protein Man1 isoform X3 [Aethina tumida]|uniref:inner nuclear membrane protein Man1 isoform X3 n=1 Tax=Aethina tumida TaxID=116153 RepID=UPI002147E7D2|nr:inner nuclear membrane protein Man1 isoform X3 [Aethina tumida]
MVDVDKLTDAELRTKLLEFGFPVMPITGTTRKVMTKKLKLLLENKNKIGGDGASGRRSLGRYSSEEESDNDVKTVKKDKNRRATMAAPLMQPPQASRGRRSNSRLNEVEQESDVNVYNQNQSHDLTETLQASLPRSPPKKEYRSTISATTRTSKIIAKAQDEFDTGSDSESDIVSNSFKSTNSAEYARGSPIKSSTFNSSYSPSKNLESSFSRNVSYTTSVSPGRSSYTAPLSGSLASDYATERLNQIRSRLSLNKSTSVTDQPSFPSTSVLNTDKLDAETPYLSNFTKRLSALSVPKDLDYKSDVKEHDTNGSSYSSIRSQLSNYRATKGRDTTYDYRTNQSSLLKNNFVSFAVLAGAALFFIVLAILYLGMRSDTSIVPAGTTLPLCKHDVSNKRGVNCIIEDDVEDAINLLNVLRPELNARAVNNKCHDNSIRSHMSEDEVVSFCTTKFGIQDKIKVRRDLRNVEILSYVNKHWNIRVAQTLQDNDVITEKDLPSNMEEVIFNVGQKITSLVVLEPELPWSCLLTNTFRFLVQSALFLGAVFTLFYLLNYLYKYYRHHKQKENEEVGFMVERIIDILQMKASEEKDNYVVINHVRDMILPVADRKRKEKTWAKAVKFIQDNESRVRTEVQNVQGEPYEVWRWIGSNLQSSPRNKSWQGQAFETQVGSVNSLPCSPTPCLKIRGMVEDGDRNTHTIREAVLSKCAHQCRILHCAVDTASNCVYLKCADQSDAAKAYMSLHGWWYARHLVTVKYLRLERYMQRFPSSPVSGPPFLKAISPGTDWDS